MSARASATTLITRDLICDGLLPGGVWIAMGLVSAFPRFSLLTTVVIEPSKWTAIPVGRTRGSSPAMVSDRYPRSIISSMTASHARSVGHAVFSALCTATLRMDAGSGTLILVPGSLPGAHWRPFASAL
eukprot:COSAG02_NODE_114_length_35585_cov_149.458293_6_plen_129_part_00